jgi:four helix bundle protein
LRFLRKPRFAQLAETAACHASPAKSGLNPRGSPRALDVVMTPDELKKRTKRFALEIIRVQRRLPRTDEARVIGRQLLRAGTSIGANYRSVCRAKTDPDFIFKLGVCVEESDEAGYWLEILVDAAIIAHRIVAELLREADELTRIFVASRETVRARVRRTSRARSAIKNQKSKIKND